MTTYVPDATLDEMPSSWSQEHVALTGIREWDMPIGIKKPISEAVIGFKSADKQVGLTNHVILFGDAQFLSKYIQEKEGWYKYSLNDTVEPINLGDVGFSRIIRGKDGTPQLVDGKPVFPTTMRQACFLYFSKDLYYVDIYYSCESLSTSTDKQISEFSYNLAELVEARIPNSNWNGRLMMYSSILKICQYFKRHPSANRK